MMVRMRQHLVVVDLCDSVKLTTTKGLFSHAGVEDAASLPMTIGQHHAIDKADKSKTLKIIYTIHTAFNDGGFLMYFNTTTNKGVPPGAYIWPPGFGFGPNPGPATSPWASVQIFDFYLDQELFNNMLVQLPNTFIRTTRLNLVTVANPKLHVEAGQQVDLLVLIINDKLPLPNIAIGPVNTADFGNVAKTTAASAELLAIVQDFAA
jgi:hypothetical protein